MIKVAHLAVRRGAFHIADLSLEVPSGAYALLVGRSGSGKTTLLEAIAGHLPLEGGQVWLDGEDRTSSPPEHRGVGLVYQQYHLFPHLSVRQNIEYGLRGARAGALKGRAEFLGEIMGIGALLDRRPASLSGGEQQRVAVARAIAPRPRILLLDEPFAALDPLTRSELRESIAELHRAEHLTTLQVTHDFADAVRLGDKVAILDGGKLLQEGTPEELVEAPSSADIARLVEAWNVLEGVVTGTPVPSGEVSSDPVEPYAGRFEADGLALEVITTWSGPAHAIIRPEDLLLAREPFPDYPRNRFCATVRRLEQRGPVTILWLDAGPTLRAAVTHATVSRLAIHPGEQVHIGLKTTAIRLVRG